MHIDEQEQTLDLILEICSVSTNSERASPAQQISQLNFFLLTVVDKHAHYIS